MCELTAAYKPNLAHQPARGGREPAFGGAGQRPAPVAALDEAAEVLVQGGHLGADAAQLPVRQGLRAQNLHRVTGRAQVVHDPLGSQEGVLVAFQRVG